MRKRRIRVVFDTNIFISAIIFEGNCRTLLEAARREVFDLFASPAILLEVSGVLQAKFKWTYSQTREVIVAVGTFAKILRPKIKIRRITDGPDNRILECALKAEADFIVSGDQRYLLPLKSFRHTKIVSPAKFLNQLKSSLITQGFNGVKFSRLESG